MKKLLLALGVLLAGFLVLFLWVRSWLTPEYIRGQIEARAAQVYAGQVTLGSVALEFPLSVGVRDLKVSDPGGQTVYLDLAAASASLGPWALLDQQVHITAFSIDRPQVLVALDADGQLEMLKHLKPSEPSEPAGALPPLAVSNLHLNQAAVTLRRPGQPDLVVGPIDAHLALLGETLTLHSLTITALETLKLEASGKVTGLMSSPRAEGVVAKVFGSMPPGLLDPGVHGKVLGQVEAALTLAGPLVPDTLGGAVVLTSSGLTWQAPDDALEPVETGAIRAEGSLREMGLDLTRATVELWGGDLTLSGRLDAADSKLTGDLKGVVVGTWLWPMLAARGFGPPLGELRLESGLVLAPTRLELKELSVRADGLRVEGGAALVAQGGAWKFQPGSELAGTFAGADLATALSLPDLVLEGQLGVAMTLAGEALAPVVAGDVEAASMQIRRPGAFSLALTELAGDFGFEDGKLDVPSLTAKVLGGSLKASAGAALDAVPPSYRFQLDALSLQVPEVFRSVLVDSPFATGALDLDLQLRGAGSDPGALVGEGKAAIRTARLTPGPTLDLLASQLKDPEIKDAELNGKFKIIEVSGGRVRLGDFSGTNGKLGPLSGEGSVGFDQSLAGAVTLQVPLSSSELPAALQGKVLPLTVKLAGTLGEPQVELEDVASALARMAGDEAVSKLETKAKEKAGELLKGLFR